MAKGKASSSGLTRASKLPPTPDGRADPYVFRYPTVTLLIGSGILGIASSVALVALLTLVHGPEVFTFYEVTVDGETTTFAMDLTAIAVPFLVAVVGTTVVHELLHGVAFRFYGYDVTYGVAPAMGAFYAAAFGQFQRRAELLRVGLTPLVGITVVCVPLLFVPVPIVALTAAFVLVLNTSGAIGDLYATWRLRRLPEGTLLYDVDIRHSYVYDPST